MTETQQNTFLTQGYLARGTQIDPGVLDRLKMAFDEAARNGALRDLANRSRWVSDPPVEVPQCPFKSDGPTVFPMVSPNDEGRCVSFAITRSFPTLLTRALVSLASVIDPG